MKKKVYNYLVIQKVGYCMKNTTLRSGKILGRICWIVVIVITVICLISQQFKINKYAEDFIGFKDKTSHGSEPIAQNQ